MKKIYIMLIALIGIFAASCSNSEYDLDNLVPDQYHKVVYFKNGGKQNLSLYTTQSGYKDSLVIVKAGSDPNLKADVNVKVLTQQEVDSIYSNVEGVDYKVIPSDAYSFDEGQELAFDKGVTGKYYPVTIDPVKIYQQIKANPDAKFVLPLQLKSKSDSINSTLDQTFIIFDVKSPLVAFQNQVQNEMMIYKSLNINVPINLTNSDMNKWDINCTLDQTENAQLVSSYNASHNTSYEVLPENAYQIKNLNIAQGTFLDTATVSVDRAYLQNDHTYLLPLKLSGTSLGDQVEIDSTVNYIVLSNPTYAIVNPDRSSWKVLFCNNDNKMSGMNSDNSGPYALLDGNVNSYWHSNYITGYASSYLASGHKMGDDYAYSFGNYYAFYAKRSTSQTVIVLDMQIVKHLVGIGVTQRPNNFKDFKSCDVYVSNDNTFKFKPLDKGGTLDDYNKVALNNWTTLCSLNDVPPLDGTYWQKADLQTIEKGGIIGRFVKIKFTDSWRPDVLNLSEFQVQELLSINGNALK
jgi:hypothetical protein